jgi:hypothetical protein
MTLLITVFAAIASTFLWYKYDKRKEYALSALLYMFWGATLMWLIDAIVSFAKEGSAFFMPLAGATVEETVINQQEFFYNQMNDLYLGIAVIALALIIWVIILLIKDPKHLYRKEAK